MLILSNTIWWIHWLFRPFSPQPSHWSPHMYSQTSISLLFAPMHVVSV
jgi:hypothetical protein